jgi:hypothetical protein
VIRPRPTRRHLGALAVLVVGGGVAIAQAAGGSGSPARPATAATAAAVPPTPRAATRPPHGVAPALPAPPGVAPAPRPPVGLCLPRRRAAGGSPPSQRLLDGFAILRRERTPEDELPAAALKALRLRGLEPVAPDAARLLRSAGDVRAWVVPVPDVDRGDPFSCSRGPKKPREGLAVVALGGAPAGGGGALRDLVRGTEPVATDPCAGPARDMLGVSGIVPDGVAAVFLTAPDGTAIRADVHDNGFSFVVPSARRPELRYVVWTGGDGTPHVQPVPAFAGVPGVSCKRSHGVPQVTPNGAQGCTVLAPAPPAGGRSARTFLVPKAPRARVLTVPHKRGRRVPPAAMTVPPSVFVPEPCSVGSALPLGGREAGCPAASRTGAGAGRRRCRPRRRAGAGRELRRRRPPRRAVSPRARVARAGPRARAAPRAGACAPSTGRSGW